MMRNSLWIVPLIFLSAAIGSTTARADSLVLSGPYVTEIESLNIDGTLYNVKFVLGDDMTFATNGEAGDAVKAIDAALGTAGIVDSATYNGGTDQLFAVDAGAGVVDYGQTTNPGTASWTGPMTTSLNGYMLDQASSKATDSIDDAGVYFAEFTALPPVSTPVPELNPTSGTSALVLVVGAVLVIRGRRRKMTQPESGCERVE